MFQEYPKALYKSLEDYVVVKDKAEEDEKREQGFASLNEPLKRKRKTKDDNSTANH
jgi:hypothetical protein